MIRGTTAPFTFKLPILASEILDSDKAKVEIKFWQRNNHGTPSAPLPITLDKDDCSSVKDDAYAIGVILRPDQTKRFSDKRKASVQGLITDANGVKYGIKEQLITVYPMYDGVYDEDMPEPDDNGFIILDGQNV